jgi:hypothetical protein
MEYNAWEPIFRLNTHICISYIYMHMHIGLELYRYDPNNNISKNNLWKNASPRAELHLKFSDQPIEVLIGGENFFSYQNGSCRV